MIRINLLPFRSTRKKENIRRQLSVFFLSLVLLLTVVFAGRLFLGSRVSSLEEKIASAQAQLEKYNQINEEIREIKKKLDSLNKKMAVIAELEHNRHEPTRMMEALTEVVIPKRMWLTKLSEEEASIDLSGIALDNKTVADFMIRLEKSGLFSSVNLKTLKQTKMQDSNLKSFQILAIKKAADSQPNKEAKS